MSSTSVNDLIRQAELEYAALIDALNAHLLPDLTAMCLEYGAKSLYLHFEALLLRRLWQFESMIHVSPFENEFKQCLHPLAVRIMADLNTRNETLVWLSVVSSRSRCHRISCWGVVRVCICGDPIFPGLKN